MKREDIIRLVRQAANEEMEIAVLSISELEKYTALVEAAERNRTWTQDHWTEYERAIVAQEREACANSIMEIVCSKPILPKVLTRQ